MFGWCASKLTATVNVSKFWFTLRDGSVEHNRKNRLSFMMITNIYYHVINGIVGHLHVLFIYLFIVEFNNTFNTKKVI